jgi:hypothetical protein
MSSRNRRENFQNRRQNFQAIAWFYDLYNRSLLDLDPPYQRRSVWNQPYKDYFIDTILLDYPSPTIFLYEEIDDNGLAKYHVVDGKQRLTTIFDFISAKFPVGENASIQELRGKYFKELPGDYRNAFYTYSFSVEYLPAEDETIINNIFDRINRNVAKLTAQELRHARYSGQFIATAEELKDWMVDNLPKNFPQIASKSQKQMKDVEFVSQLLLMLEDTPRGYDSEELDIAFSDRDDEWDKKDLVIKKFKSSISFINNICEKDSQDKIKYSRFKNQADFYTLVGVISELQFENKLPDEGTIIKKLETFISLEDQEKKHQKIAEYFEYVKSASNRTKARQERQRILKDYIITGHE